MISVADLKPKSAPRSFAAYTSVITTTKGNWFQVSFKSVAVFIFIVEALALSGQVCEKVRACVVLPKLMTV